MGFVRLLKVWVANKVNNSRLHNIKKGRERLELDDGDHPNPA